MRIPDLSGLTILLLFPLLASAQSGTIAGRILGESDANPIVGATVELLNANRGMAVGVDGQFLLGQLQPGHDTLRVRALGYYSLDCPVAIKAHSITFAEITLKIAVFQPHPSEPPGECGTGSYIPPAPADYAQTHCSIEYLESLNGIRGQVRNRRTGEPIREADVRLKRAKRSTTTGSGGDFFFFPLKPGPDTLLVSGNYMPHFSGSEPTFLGFEGQSIPVAITADSELDVQVALYERFEERVENWHDPVPAVQPQPDKFTVAGRVCDRATGAAIFEALVSCEYRYRDTTGVVHEGCCVLVPTDGSGHYALNNLDPGWYRFSAAFPDYEPANHELTAPPGSFHEINFDLMQSTDE